VAITPPARLSLYNAGGRDVVSRPEKQQNQTLFTLVAIEILVFCCHLFPLIKAQTD
jgi:hypothetical protein